MRARLKHLMLLALDTDGEAVRVGSERETRCLHCRARLRFSSDGEPIGPATLEHVIPSSWFGRRGVADLTHRVGAADDPRNLAIACRRCNHAKGARHDPYPGREASRQVVEALLARRWARWRDPPGE
ncbi:MAG: HNH endonuclease [Xanthomonadales bacterium]|jgi:5-methylcytosine-specific restriction endonuclease McrA|nr:HNH endonuclease [Xanthomonadales bacterium]